MKKDTIHIKTRVTLFRKSLYCNLRIIPMQKKPDQKLYIPAIAFLMAIMVFALSPMTPAMAQDSADVDASEHSEERSYEGKDGKSCDKKNKDKSDTSMTSGNNA